MSDYFIGYNWPQPPGVLKAVKRAALGLGLGVVGLSGALATGHVGIEGGVFEYGDVRPVTGTVIIEPYPMLKLQAAGPDGWPLLVVRGKHGAEDAVVGLAGQQVQVQATRIARGAHTMLELAGRPEPVASAEAVSASVAFDDSHGLTVGTVATLRGEIVDTKCYLGVMVPGDGTTHRDCASLCLRGGIPPAIVVNAAGEATLVLLVGPTARIRARAAALAGEPVELTGTIGRTANWTTVETDPAAWRTLAP